MEFYDQRVTVVGLGKSGLSVCRWLSGRGARVTVSDFKKEGELDGNFLEEVRRLGAELETGGHRKETFLESDWIIVSPGVPLDIEPLEAAREAGIPVMGEMELASRQVRIPMIGVTGTNGKSTATALLGHMMEKAGKRAFVGGNIGTPLMDYVTGNIQADVAVLEVSSFQLDSMEHFHPAVSLILNISPDHLDRYPDYDAYAASKLSVIRNQGPGDYVILNDDDERLSRVRPETGVTVLRYGTERKETRHAFPEGDCLKVILPGRKVEHFDLGLFQLPGMHNLQNLMGCVLVGLSLGIDGKAIQESIDDFRGLPHRMEFVGRIKGVDFYDDSKATNVEAAARAVEGFARPVVLIAGGRDKGGDYGSLVEASRYRVKTAVLMGEAGPLLTKALNGVVPVLQAVSMAEAVKKAFSRAEPEDVILLAPACSSFDMFTDYGHRGRIFREEVNQLDHERH